MLNSTVFLWCKCQTEWGKGFLIQGLIAVGIIIIQVCGELVGNISSQVSTRIGGHCKSGQQNNLFENRQVECAKPIYWWILCSCLPPHTVFKETEQVLLWQPHRLTVNWEPEPLPTCPNYQVPVIPLTIAPSNFLSAAIMSQHHNKASTAVLMQIHFTML